MQSNLEAGRAVALPGAHHARKTDRLQEKGAKCTKERWQRGIVLVADQTLFGCGDLLQGAE
ncbi:MAG: hypothetical protein ACK51Y_02435, partial [Burkholderiales bacterium]